MFCRLYAGVHFPFDVIDGRIVGNQVRSDQALVF